MATSDDQQPADSGHSRGRSDRLPEDPVWRKVALAAHDAAVAAGEDGYIDPVSGLFVMTAVHLRGQGGCCDSGCRHCPYGPGHPADSGPAPRASGS